MRRPALLLPLLLPLLASVAVLPAGPRAAEAAEKREFKERNFTWELPSDEWVFGVVQADALSAGYVALAQCGHDGGVRADVRVVPAEGLTPDALAEEVLGQLKGDFEKVATGSVTRGRLSGLDGSLVVLQGTAKNGAPLWIRAYAIAAEGQLHQLIVTAYNGAEGKRSAEIDALRRGYRLIAGAGPEEAAGAGEPKLGGGDVPDSEAFPPGGPKQEGRTVVFPSHNLRWTLPEGSPFAWRGAAENEKKPEGGRLLQARAIQERKPEKEGEPDRTACLVTLFVGDLEPGVTAEALVNSPGIQSQISQGIFEGKHDASKTKVDAERKVGNHTGGSLMMAGARDKVVTYFILIFVTLKNTRYEWQVRLEGGRDVLQTWGKPLGALMDGVEFPDTKESVRGPVAVEAVRSHNMPRGHSADKETETPAAGIQAKKPKGLYAVPYEGGADPQLRLAWEARSADGQAYIYFDVHGYPLNQQGQKNLTAEEVITQRESQWKTNAGDDAITITKGKVPHFKAAFGGADGLGYRFTGSLAGHPFVEQGWVVSSKNNLLWLRVQFGGAGAEKTMDAQWKAIKKGIKFP